MPALNSMQADWQRIYARVNTQLDKRTYQKYRIESLDTERDINFYLHNADITKRD